MAPPITRTTTICTTNANTNTTNSASASNTPSQSITLLSLPIELRLQIYSHILHTSSIASIRPQRKIGWNRPHADLTNPALLFESDAHVSLKHLFHSKLTKGDHALILEVVLKHVKVLVVDHADLLALLKVASSSPSNPSAVSECRNGRGDVGRGGKGTMRASQSRSLANVVRKHLRIIDFSDRMDEIVCQPNDIVKLVKGLPGLRSVWLTSRHVQRYSGTIEDHVEFARERVEREAQTSNSNRDSDTRETSMTPSSRDTDPTEPSTTTIPTSTTTSTTPTSELRRLHLRSPMTDGTRLLISPLPLSPSKPSSRTTTPTWVVVDLSMLIWQHFLYVGPPYRDHWRPHKIRKLLDVAEGRGVDVVLGLRGIEFDPLPVPVVASLAGVGSGGANGSGSGSGNGRGRIRGGAGGGAVFKGEMSTRDWMLRIRQVRGVGCGGVVEYCVKQRRGPDECNIQ